ncbi:MAG: hypothetical protein H6577_07325 [Lewinellaceae bacterium]|nr:hypothetical protein [Saprospiraceae bacterium]MCB9337922.1 hypothetical protein [Lewinellaceae bacterium]
MVAVLVFSFTRLLLIQSLLGVLHDELGHVGTQDGGIPFLTDAFGLLDREVLYFHPVFIKIEGDFLCPPFRVKACTFKFLYSS